MSEDNPNPYITPGNPRYNPAAQSHTEADAWMPDVYPGFFDPTQVPMQRGDTQRPMQQPPSQFNHNGQQPIPPINPSDFKEILRGLIGTQQPLIPPQPQYQVTSPTVNPIRIPLVFDLAFNITINLDVQQGK